MENEQTQIDAQKVINSLLRQVAEMSQKLAMVEALLEHFRETHPDLDK